MEKFDYTIHVSAKNKEESLQIMRAITRLIKLISAADLTFMADITERKPGWIEKAKPLVKHL